MLADPTIANTINATNARLRKSNMPPWLRKEMPIAMSHVKAKQRLAATSENQ